MSSQFRGESLYLFHIPLHTGVVVWGCLEAQDGEYWNGGIDWGGAVYAPHNNSIHLTVIAEIRNKYENPLIFMPCYQMWLNVINPNIYAHNGSVEINDQDQWLYFTW